MLEMLFVPFFYGMKDASFTICEKENSILSQMNFSPYSKKALSLEDIIKKIKNKRYFIFHDFIKDIMKYISSSFFPSRIVKIIISLTNNKFLHFFRVLK